VYVHKDPKIISKGLEIIVSVKRSRNNSNYVCENNLKIIICESNNSAERPMYVPINETKENERPLEQWPVRPPKINVL
jgi:hypothetical protein